MLLERESSQIDKDKLTFPKGTDYFKSVCNKSWELRYI